MSHIKLFMLTFKSELRAILSDAGALLIILFAMLIYTTIYSVAYGREVARDVTIGIVDEDNTSSSRKLIDGIRSGPNTVVGYMPTSAAEAERLFYTNDIYGVVYIPLGYEQELLAGNQTDVAIILDSSHLLVYRQVLQQAAADILTQGANVEVGRLMSRGMDAASIEAIVEPVAYDGHVMYNAALGYGSFVMPTIMVVIIQQTLIIGIALVAIRRRQQGAVLKATSTANSIIMIFAKILVYILLYGVNSIIILAILWPIFGFPYAGNTADVIILMALYITVAAAFGLTLSHLFKRREAPLMLILWSSVPVLLLAGISYPKEAFPEWLYAIGELLPSSSAVRAYVNIGTMGASLWDVSHEIFTLIALALLYITTAVITEKAGGVYKKIAK